MFNLWSDVVTRRTHSNRAYQTSPHKQWRRRVFGSGGITMQGSSKLGDNAMLCTLAVFVVHSIHLLARDVIYTSRLMLRCQCPFVCPSVRLSVTEVHWRIIANLGFKFRSHFTAHCGRRAACGRIISRHASQC